MNFQEYFEQQELKTYLEVSQYHIDRALDVGYGSKPLFDNIFGTDIRQVEPFYNSSMQADIEDVVPKELYNIDFEKWVGYKVTDTDKKNPTRLNKVLNSIMRDLKKKSEDPNISQWTQDNFKKRYLSIDKLLKYTNLQNEYKKSLASEYIVYSRSPIDILRMSDHQKWKSCHEPGGDYFNCAIADAQNNGGVIYVISADDYLKIKDNLQAPEIFKDDDRGIPGIIPRNRMRIRAVMDSNKNIFAVPSTRIYGDRTSAQSLTRQVHAWAKRQDISKINFEDTLYLLGGSYEDTDYSVEREIRNIWNINANVNTTRETSEVEFEDEEDEWVDHEERKQDFIDDTINEFNDREIFANYNSPLFETIGSYDLQPYDGSITFDIELGELYLSMIGTPEELDELESETVITLVEDVDYNFVSRKIMFNFYTAEIQDYITYDEDAGGDYDEGGYINNIYRDITQVLQRLTNTGDDFYSDDAYQVNMIQFAAVKLILKKIGKESSRFDSADKIFDDVIEFEQELEDEVLVKISTPPFPDRIFSDYNKVRLFIERYNDQLLEIVEIVRQQYYSFLIKYTSNKKLAESMTKDLDYSLVVPHNTFNENQRNFKYQGEHITYERDTSYTIRTPYLKFKLTDLSTITWDYILEIDPDVAKNILKVSKEFFDFLQENSVTNDPHNKKVTTDLQELVSRVKKHFSLNITTYDPNQLELDLSKVNRNMGKFEDTIEWALKEAIGNMGTGGISNMGGPGTKQKPPINNSSGGGMQTGGGVQMKHSSGAASTINNAQELGEFDTWTKLQKTDPNTFNTTIADVLNKDPEKFNRFFSHISKSIQSPNV